MGNYTNQIDNVPATKEMLQHFSRDTLRELATRLGVNKGQNKDDTIGYLAASNRVFVTITVNWERRADLERERRIDIKRAKD